MANNRLASRHCTRRPRVQWIEAESGDLVNVRKVSRLRNQKDGKGKLFQIIADLPEGDFASLTDPLPPATAAACFEKLKRQVRRGQSVSLADLLQPRFIVHAIAETDGGNSDNYDDAQRRA